MLAKPLAAAKPRCGRLFSVAFWWDPTPLPPLSSIRQSIPLATRRGARRLEAQGHVAALAVCERRLHDASEARRALHERVQELRGAVRVVLRARPFLSHVDGQDESVSALFSS